jgi:hypothetical protein
LLKCEAIENEKVNCLHEAIHRRGTREKGMVTRWRNRYIFCWKTATILREKALALLYVK